MQNTTYVERDVRETVNVGDIETFGRFVRLCAGRNGQLLNLTSLAVDFRGELPGLSPAPHHRNFGKRWIKTPQLYFLDSGLLCNQLRIRAPEDVRPHASRGSVFEGFVAAESLENYLNAGRERFLRRDPILEEAVGRRASSGSTGLRR